MKDVRQSKERKAFPIKNVNASRAQKYIEMEAKPDKDFLYTEGPVLNEQ